MAFAVSIARKSAGLQLMRVSECSAIAHLLFPSTNFTFTGVIVILRIHLVNL